MQNSSPNYLQSRLFVQYLDIAHGFSGRLGGVSRGAYSSLNCGLGSNDDPDSIRENRRIVASRLDLAASALSTPWQVHGDVVRTLDGPLLDTEPPSADGVVTATPGVALGVSTADCVPVLFADPGAGVIGAAHAGWRGALSGIVAATVDAMIALGAERARISAGIGPAIQQQSYEVGAELRANSSPTMPTTGGSLHLAAQRRSTYSICRVLWHSGSPMPASGTSNSPAWTRCRTRKTISATADPSDWGSPTTGANSR